MGETIETLEPTKLLVMVDFPAFGAPIKATNPQRVFFMLFIHNFQKITGSLLFGGFFIFAFAERKRFIIECNFYFE